MFFGPKPHKLYVKKNTNNNNYSIYNKEDLLLYYSDIGYDMINFNIPSSYIIFKHKDKCYGESGHVIINMNNGKILGRCIGQEIIYNQNNDFCLFINKKDDIKSVYREYFTEINYFNIKNGKVATILTINTQNSDNIIFYDNDLIFYRSYDNHKWKAFSIQKGELADGFADEILENYKYIVNGDTKNMPSKWY